MKYVGGIMVNKIYRRCVFINKMKYCNFRYYVGMCGDGVNDCGVFKMVYVGILLFEVEVLVVFFFIFKFFIVRIDDILILI